MAPLLEEEENYVRLALLLKGVSPRAVRHYFDTEFPPTYLPSTLNMKFNTLQDLKLKKYLSQTQWSLLFPKNGVPYLILNYFLVIGVPDSKTFDVTLMICLIRNLTSITQPINGFDSLPLPIEISKGADLARIKWYRNKLAHHDSDKIDTAYFNKAWINISHAVSRLGGQSMNQECQELKAKILDQSNQEIMLEIKQSQKEIKELRLLLEDPIPRNIRDQIQEELKKWKEDDNMFLETNGAKTVFKCIKENGCVVVTGSSGTGKSSLVRHVALQMQVGGYDILPVANPEQIVKWYNPSKKNLFVVDDFCGTYTMNAMKFENWKSLMEKIKTLVEKKPVKLIMSCSLQVYKDEKMKSLSFYQSCECNLLSKDMRLSKTEKQSIAELYLKTDASEINEFYDRFDCFPLLCQLHSKNTKLRIVEFFKNPFVVYREEIYKLQTEGAYGKYCALALCVMFNNCLKEEWLTDDVDKDIKTVIKNTYEACKVVKGMSRLVLRDELDSLTHTFIRKDDNMYRTIHDKLFDFLAFHFGSVMIDCVINNASSYFISERFLFKTETNCSSDEFIITVPQRYQTRYIIRMVDDWSRGKVVDVFCNINMEDQIFRRKFLSHINGLGIPQQRQLAGSNDTDDNSTPLISSCYKGDIDLVRWCLDHCIININHCRHDGVSPLFFACQEGHTKVVQMLITSKADINKCDETGSSPLFIACNNGHTEVVQMLINNKADINKCNNEEVSSLFISCQQGYTNVVKMLINNKADINKCNDEEVCPLYIACQQGCTNVVKMLINNNADINKCDDQNVSPLYIACQEGHTQVVKMLIFNKADINKCNDTGTSPLFIACQKGHTEVVQLLINKRADINKCKKTGESPIFMACYKGNSQIVQLLLKHEADSSLKYNGQTPLDIAKRKSYKHCTFITETEITLYMLYVI
ncbi:unnamed protein product [Mytilus coruscus]|uniref:Uncharacterized protein n=1 Tax=Mytilus coruscus TaxID=42192 RepID=A0A6J8CVK6_MYTCO|nr:unnamed protein product [Mytilus coruscus]